MTPACHAPLSQCAKSPRPICILHADSGRSRPDERPTLRGIHLEVLRRRTWSGGSHVGGCGRRAGHQMARRTTHQRLVRILRAAYSGELAAAYAYRGHWKSLKNEAEREKVKQIEREEWAHRRHVGLMLDELGSGPAGFREVRLSAVGRAVGALCHVTGWFLPMYFAGWVESRNVSEYELAAGHAGELGLADYEGKLREMAGVEGEHEAFFKRVVAGHRLLPLMGRIFGWGVAPGGEAPRNESA